MILDETTGEVRRGRGGLRGYKGIPKQTLFFFLTLLSLFSFPFSCSFISLQGKEKKIK